MGEAIKAPPEAPANPLTYLPRPGAQKRTQPPNNSSAATKLSKIAPSLGSKLPTSAQLSQIEQIKLAGRKRQTIKFIKNNRYDLIKKVNNEALVTYECKDTDSTSSIYKDLNNCKT